MRPISVTVGPVGTVSANNIALSQTPGAAGALTLNGSLVTAGVATLPTPQRILITTGDTTHTFTVVGATPTGSSVTEVIGPVSATAQSALDYATVSSITINGAATAAVTVGTNGIAATPWVRVDEWALPQIAIQCNVTGTVNYTVQSTLDENTVPSALVWVSTSDTAAVGAAGTIQTNYAYCPKYIRCLLNSGSGSVTMIVTQSGSATY